jgi:hypothetical protein
MVTMIDQMFDRAYQQGRAEMNATLTIAVRRAGTAIANAFRVLNRIEYDAPWLHRTRKGRHA